MKPIFTICYLLFIVLIANAQDGTLDSSYCTGGVQTLPDDYAYNSATVLQPDGKLILLSRARYIPSQYITLTRLDTSGFLDPTFGSGGSVITSFSATGDPETGFGKNMLLQADGKIVIIGTVIETSSDEIIARYNSNGTLDNSFSGDGKLLDHYNYEIYDIEQLSSGKYMILGYNYLGIVLARINADGTTDMSFGSGGYVLNRVGTSSYVSFCFTKQVDDKLVVAGTLKTRSSQDSTIVISRFKENGNLDSSFATNGRYFANYYGNVRDIVMQTDGKIVIGGTSNIGGYNHYLIARFNPNGTPDSTFDYDGVVFKRFSLSNEGLNVHVLPNGKILIGGMDYIYYGLARFNSDGSLDSTFAGVGHTDNPMPGLSTIPNCLEVQSDGKILQSGDASDGTLYYCIILRYNGTLGTGLIDFDNTNLKMDVYPNPINENESFTYELEKEETLSLRLYTIEGKLIHSFFENKKTAKGTHSETLTFPSLLPAGQYLLTISNSKGNKSIKIFKSN